MSFEKLVTSTWCLSLFFVALLCERKRLNLTLVIERRVKCDNKRTFSPSWMHCWDSNLYIQTVSIRNAASCDPRSLFRATVFRSWLSDSKVFFLVSIVAHLHCSVHVTSHLIAVSHEISSFFFHWARAFPFEERSLVAYLWRVGLTVADGIC